MVTGVPCGVVAESSLEKARKHTRGGDAGQTSLVGGRRVDKHDPRVAAYGDEGFEHAVELLGFEYDELSHDKQHCNADDGDRAAVEPTPRASAGFAFQEWPHQLLECAMQPGFPFG